MAKLFPVRFNYIPYPLWRRKMPFPLGFITKPLWYSIYPVYEDKNPPDDAAAMADYLVRYGLMPDLEMRTIYNALHTSPAEIEYVPAGVANPAPASPIRIPAQWEPMEAVLLNWPVMYPPLWAMHAQMAEAIAPVAQVIVNIPAPMWGHAAWLYLTLRAKLGNHLENVRFVHLPSNDIWVRDHGPFVGYAPDGQRTALNAIYDHLPNYPQELDNKVPIQWAIHSNTPLRKMGFHTEGGNLWTDDEGTLIMTEQVFNENPGYSYHRLENSLHTLLDFKKLIITPRLMMEETGHVDLLAKLADRNTILIPQPQNGIHAPILKKIASQFRRETNALGERYTVIDLPMPQVYLNWFVYPITRSYTNALTVNGRVLVPVYKIKEDDVALRVYQQAMPDYEIIPIDAKAGINGGGAVHCMTKEIPSVVSS